MTSNKTPFDDVTRTNDAKIVDLFPGAMSQTRPGSPTMIEENTMSTRDASERRRELKERGGEGLEGFIGQVPAFATGNMLTTVFGLEGEADDFGAIGVCGLGESVSGDLARWGPESSRCLSRRIGPRNVKDYLAPQLRQIWKEHIVRLSALVPRLCPT
jgi:hypothetical protein